MWSKHAQKRSSRIFFVGIQQGPITHLLLKKSFTLIFICQHRDSNEFGNHFRTFSARMVHSAESAWAVPYQIKSNNIWDVSSERHLVEQTFQFKA